MKNSPSRQTDGEATRQNLSEGVTLSHPLTTTPSADLPEGWVEVTLGEVAEWSSGGTPKSTEPRFYDGNIPWLNIGDLTEGLVEKSQRSITQEGFENSSAKWIPVGAFLFAMYGASIGRMGITNFRCTSNQAIAFTTKIYASIPVKYLFYFIQHIKTQIIDLAKGGAQPNVSLGVVKSLTLPLPPLAEQHRIVARLDALLGQAAAARARLERVPALLRRFRASVLASAVSGRLTEEWREAGGEKEQKLDFPQNEIGWYEMLATEACSVVSSGSTPKNNPFHEQEAIPYLKVYNIVNQQINFHYKPQYIKQEVHEKELKRCRVYPKDVLINIVGPPLGKVALVPDEFPEWNINQAIVLFRCRDFVVPKFLYYVLCDGAEIKAIENEYRGSAGQSNISLSQCRNFNFSIPPLSEQHEIVRRVESLLSLADGLEARCAAQQRALDRLPQALLAQAFRGELTEQNPADEPAAALLARVRAERAGGVPKGGKKKKG